VDRTFAWLNSLWAAHGGHHEIPGWLVQAGLSDCRSASRPERPRAGIRREGAFERTIARNRWKSLRVRGNEEGENPVPTEVPPIT